MNSGSRILQIYQTHMCHAANKTMRPTHIGDNKKVCIQSEMETPNFQRHQVGVLIQYGHSARAALLSRGLKVNFPFVLTNAFLLTTEHKIHTISWQVLR